MKRKLLAILCAMIVSGTALTMLMIEIPEIGITADAAIVASGKCGENVDWSLDSDGTLTISGWGEIYTYFMKSQKLG